MFAYNLRIAWKSLRRTPVLSSLLVAGIALGIAVATAFVAAYSVLAQDPIPEKSSVLHYVQLDAWNPDEPWDGEDPQEPPDQLTYRDAVAMAEAPGPVRRAAMHKTQFTVHPEGAEQRPFRALTRVTHGDFFAMFDVPFRYGSGWDAEADARPEAVVVIDAATNDQVFGGENSVGRRLRLDDREFTVVGVLDEWYPRPKFYDPLNDDTETPEALYVPFRWSTELELRTAGNRSGWMNSGQTYQDLIESESIWIQFWVELPDAASKETLESHIEGYIAQQKTLGRFGRPANYKLRTVPEWLEARNVVPRSARVMLIISLLFLLVCAVNLIGILLGKFLARAPEVGVRRALGASRGQVFLQHLIECLVVGGLGGVFGVIAAVGVLRWVESLVRFGNEGPDFFVLQPQMVAVGIALALAAGVVAGAYPAWRICRVAPAAHLKQQ
jgi:putative ABC transport system permease protein